MIKFCIFLNILFILVWEQPIHHKTNLFLCVLKKMSLKKENIIKLFRNYSEHKSKKEFISMYKYLSMNRNHTTLNLLQEYMTNMNIKDKYIKINPILNQQIFTNKKQMFQPQDYHIQYIPFTQLKKLIKRSQNNTKKCERILNIQIFNRIILDYDGLKQDFCNELQQNGIEFKNNFELKSSGDYIMKRFVIFVVQKLSKNIHVQKYFRKTKNGGIVINSSEPQKIDKQLYNSLQRKYTANILLHSKDHIISSNMYHIITYVTFNIHNHVYYITINSNGGETKLPDWPKVHGYYDYKILNLVPNQLINETFGNCETCSNCNAFIIFLLLNESIKELSNLRNNFLYDRPAIVQQGWNQFVDVLKNKAKKFYFKNNDIKLDIKQSKGPGVYGVKDAVQKLPNKFSGGGRYNPRKRRKLD